jgi:hypothetical protein
MAKKAEWILKITVSSRFDTIELVELDSINQMMSNF